MTDNGKLTTHNRKRTNVICNHLALTDGKIERIAVKRKPLFSRKYIQKRKTDNR